MITVAPVRSAETEEQTEVDVTQKLLQPWNVILLDDDVSAVGTANFDNRSFRLNFEITAVIVEPDFIESMEKMFEADFEKSRLMRAGEYDDKSFWFRFAVRLCSLTSPIQ